MNKQQQVMPFSNGGNANQNLSSQQHLPQSSARNSLTATESAFQQGERCRTSLTLPIKKANVSSKTGKGKGGNQQHLKSSNNQSQRKKTQKVNLIVAEESDKQHDAIVVVVSGTTQ